MTSHDYHVAMRKRTKEAEEKRVGVADLKARLSEHLRYVRAGRPLVVMDRDTPVAQIEPYESAWDRLVVRRPAPGAPKPYELVPPEPVKLDRDIVEILLEDRNSGR
jgi:antitoxin (DNA-binding transcriptional repressor) of toxin-antitoxin stability system